MLADKQMSKRRKNKKKKRILEGHRRVGKRFIPPMKQLPMMNSTSYVDDMLPELIWIGLLNERVGYIRGARIIERVFLAVNNLKQEDQKGNFALISCFNSLTSEQKNELVAALRNDDVLEEIQNSIAPLVLLYNNCPLSFLGPPPNIYSENDLVSFIKRCVGKTIDRYKTPAIVLYGAMLLYRLVSKTIFFSSELDLPDFNAVINSPDSEEAKRAAGFMRANGLAEFGMLKLDNSWAKHFWDRNFELSPCEFE